MLHLTKVAFALVVSAAPALAQSAARPATPPPSTTDQVQKDRAPETGANGNRTSRDRQSRPQESDRPAIGPQTTQGLMQDAIARSNSR